MKILLINLQRTGDILQSLHIIFSLKKKYSNCKIYYLTNNVHESALKIAINYIEKIFSIDFFFIFRNFHNSNFFEPFIYLKNFFKTIENENFDKIINLNFSRLSAIISNIIYGKDKIGAYLQSSELIEINNDILKTLFLNLEAPDFKVNIVECYLKALHLPYAKPLFFKPVEKKSSAVIFHPGASKEEKEWGINNFIALAIMLNKKIIITGGKSEIDKNSLLELELKKRDLEVENLTGRTDFFKLIEILKQADFLISGDTSIVHLAAFTPIKSVTIFLGNAYHYHTYPYCPDKIVIFPNIKCYPCEANYKCDKQICKKSITPETVFSAINFEKKENILFTKLTNDGYVSLENG